MRWTCPPLLPPTDTDFEAFRSALGYGLEWGYRRIRHWLESAASPGLPGADERTTADRQNMLREFLVFTDKLMDLTWTWATVTDPPNADPIKCWSAQLRSDLDTLDNLVGKSHLSFFALSSDDLARADDLVRSLAGRAPKRRTVIRPVPQVAALPPVKEEDGPEDIEPAGGGVPNGDQKAGDGDRTPDPEAQPANAEPADGAVSGGEPKVSDAPGHIILPHLGDVAWCVEFFPLGDSYFRNAMGKGIRQWPQRGPRDKKYALRQDIMAYAEARGIAPIKQLPPLLPLPQGFTYPTM